MPAHLELSDLVQAGMFGLLDAAGKYNSQTEASFSTYATYRIKGAILDCLPGQDAASRKLRRRYRELQRTRRKLSQELQRSPTECEIADRIGFDLNTLRATLLDIHYLHQMSGADCAAASADLERSDASIAQLPESIYEITERAWLVREMVGKLPTSHRTVIILHYDTDLSLKEIGGSIGLAERRVSRIHKKALQRINAMLTARGIISREEI